MKKVMKLCRTALALALVFSLTLGLCANGLTVFAAETKSSTSQKDNILNEFFGNGETTKDSFANLLNEAQVMNGYKNSSFYYVPNKNSYYVAIGDETVAGKSNKGTTYADELAKALGVSVKKIAAAQLQIQDVYAKLSESENSAAIAKADLISIGWSNYGATFAMFNAMGLENPVGVSDAQWETLVGKENLPKVEELLDEMFQKLGEYDTSSFGAYDLEIGLEWYAYTYMCNAIHQCQVIEAVRVINHNAVIVLVGTYNDMEDVLVSVSGGTMNLGDLMEDFVKSSNLLSTKNAAHYNRVAYVHAPEVATDLDGVDTSKLSAKLFVLNIIARKGLPNATGHTYIKNQIYNAISNKCSHTWDDGVVTTNPTCNKKGVKTFTCTWCGETKTESVPATGVHTPKTKQENRKEPTCGSAGSYDLVTYCSVCNVEIERETKTVPATGKHDYTSTVTKEPDCDTAGERTYTCTVCGGSYTEAIEATGHNYKSVVTAPTCTEDGYTTYTCSDCGHSYVGDKVAALGHSYGEWTQTKAPTCTAAGEERRDCERCDHYETRTVAVSEHTYKAVVTAPTCTEAGYTTYTCSVCGDSYVGDEVKALGHSYGEWTQTKAPTCTAAGEERRDCERCDHYETRDVAVVDHTYEAVVTAPTCTEGGYTTYTCSVCGDSYVADQVDALGHIWETTTTEATCCEDGQKTDTCATCGEKKTEVIPATGEHDLVYADNENDVGHRVTCGNSGKVLNEDELHSYVDGVCSKCGAKELCQHAWDDGVVIKPATCCETGEKLFTCSKCEEQYTEILPVDPDAHTGNNHVENDKSATCTDTGYTGDTVCECGAIVESGKIIAMLNHSYGQWTVTKAPTCTEAGEERRECSNCDHSETRVVEATAHTYEAVVTAPTCTEEGYTTYTCVCGRSYVADKVSALGHSFGEWTQSKAPTCTEVGEERRECANCDHSETRVVAVAEHTYEAVVTAPTCTEEGYTTYTCVCGRSYVADKVSALGHTWQTSQEDETCCEDGLTIDTCEVCGETKTEVIPANGEHDLIYTDNENGVGHLVSCRNSGKEVNANELHDFVDGVCSKCDAKEICQHQWNDGEVTKAPTCVATGEKLYACSLCGETYKETLAVDASAHTGNNHTENAKDATCTEPGYTGDTVCECGAVISSGEEIAVMDHSFGEWFQTKVPTCTEPGQERRECASCDHYETREVAVTEHTYKAVVTAPTCTTGGYTTYTCSQCGDSYVADEVAALDHSYGEWFQTKAPTCTQPGQERRECVNCDRYETREVAVAEHTYKAVVTAPTCTEDGYTTYTCSQCGDSYVWDEVPALGHAWMIISTDATCCEDGEAEYTCVVCNEIEKIVIPATGDHALTYVDNENGASHRVICGNSGKELNANELHSFADGVCTKCGAKEICKHVWDDGVVTKAATCCETGEKLFTCNNCGEQHKEILAVDPTAHTGVNHVENEKAPTCTQPGYTGDTVCECGAVIASGEEIAVVEHNYQAVVTVPTCTEGGYTTYTCKDCSATYVADHTEPTGHTWDEGVVSKEPTATTDGEKTYTCTACGEQKKEVIPAAGEDQKDVIYDLPEDETVAIPENDCFEGGTTVKVEQLEEGDIFETVQQSMQNRAENYVVYEFTATMDGVTVQPSGKLTVTFAIPAGYSDNVAVYYMTERGKLTKLTAVVDAETRTVTVEVEHFSTYILADEDTAPDVLLGDVNGDGRVNVRDARAILRYIAGLVEESELNVNAADFNGDGRINVRDARAILNYIAGMG